MKKISNSTIIYLFLALILLASGTSLTLSKYSGEASGEAGASVAAWDFSNPNSLGELKSVTDLPGLPGESKVYEFKIQNHSGLKVSEVKLKYNIQIFTNNNLPLTFTLTSADSDTTNHAKTLDTQGTLGGDTTPGTETLKTSWIHGVFLGNDGGKTHNYNLTIAWPEGSKDKKYIDEIEFVRIKVSAEQADV